MVQATYFYLFFNIKNNDILLVKKDEKTGNKEIDFVDNVFIHDLNDTFHLNLFNNKEIIDEVKNGIIFVEHIQSEDRDVQKLSSIFKYIEIAMNNFEVNAQRPGD